MFWSVRDNMRYNQRRNSAWNSMSKDFSGRENLSSIWRQYAHSSRDF